MHTPNSIQLYKEHQMHLDFFVLLLIFFYDQLTENKHTLQMKYKKTEIWEEKKKNLKRPTWPYSPSTWG